GSWSTRRATGAGSPSGWTCRRTRDAPSTSSSTPIPDLPARPTPGTIGRSGVSRASTAAADRRMSDSIPLLDLTGQWAELRSEALAAIERVCDTQRFVLGPEVEALERELAALVGVKHAIGVSSGTDALLLALMARDVGSGVEVVTTTYSFFATAGSIARVGARPVLVDIDPISYNLRPDAVRATITPRTKAIMPVHLNGQCA